MPGMPAATAGGGASGNPPNAAGSAGLTVGAIAFQLGGTASAPIAAPRPMAADTPPPRLPSSLSPAAGAATAPPSPSAAAARPRRLAAVSPRSPRHLEAEQTRNGTQRVTRHVEAGQKMVFQMLALEPQASSSEQVIEEPREPRRGRRIPG